MSADTDTASRDRQIYRLYLQGRHAATLAHKHSLRALARKYGLSHQRIQQIIARLKQEQSHRC